MPFTVACPHSANSIGIADGAIGMFVAYPHCHGQIQVRGSPTVFVPQNNPFETDRPIRRRRTGKSPLALIVVVVLIVALLAGVGIVANQYIDQRAEERVAALADKIAAAGPKNTGPPAPMPATAKRATGKPPVVMPAEPVAPPNESKATRLQRLDKEAMELFRMREVEKGFFKLGEASANYKDSVPADCTPEECLALAVIYTRMIAFAAKDFPLKKTQAWIDLTEEYARRGGIPPDEFQDWFKDIVSGTAALAGRK